MSAARPVLLLQLGEAPDAVRDAHGTYVEWYLRAWGGPLDVRDGREAGRHPDPRGWAGIVVTGSARSLVTPEPWMDDAAELVRRAADAGVPVLGVCFGHQLIAYAVGGRVLRNPKGWEVGTARVALTDAGRRDPLFRGCADEIAVNLTHEDMVCPDTLAGLTRLAANEQTPVQAVAWGDHVRGVQFHPEMTGDITRGYVHARRHLLAGDADALAAATVDCPDGTRVIRNFRRFFVERA